VNSERKWVYAVMLVRTSLKRTTRKSLGPFTAPTWPNWRRSRLLRIGTSGDAVDRDVASIIPEPDERTLLNRVSKAIKFYGSTSSVPSMRAQLTNASWRRRISLSGLPHAHEIDPPSPSHPHSLNARSSTFFKRPVAYDAPMDGKSDSPNEDNEAVKANGIRVW
jgi:hypothetical protein